MDVRLTWDANSEGDLLKYRVYNGPASGVYTANQDVTAPTVTVDISDLPNGRRWYFAISAIDNALNESTKSSAVSVTNKHNRLL